MPNWPLFGHMCRSCKRSLITVTTTTQPNRDNNLIGYRNARPIKFYNGYCTSLYCSTRTKMMLAVFNTSLMRKINRLFQEFDKCSRYADSLTPLLTIVILSEKNRYTWSIFMFLFVCSMYRLRTMITLFFFCFRYAFIMVFSLFRYYDMKMRYVFIYNKHRW